MDEKAKKRYCSVLRSLLTKVENRLLLDLFSFSVGCSTPSNSPIIDESEHDAFAASRGVGI